MRIRMTIAAGLAAALALTSPALADSVFDGTWKLDIKSARLPDKPDSYSLKDGVYSCTTCNPPLTVPADGKFHAVADRPYYDEVQITAIDGRSIRQVSRKGGKVVGESTMTVSPDGNSAMVVFNDTSGTKPVSGKGMRQRVGKATVGAHPVSGDWKATVYSDLSDSGLTMTMKLDGPTVSLSTPTGASYVAKTDGVQAPVMGDPGWTTVSVRRTGPSTLEETDYRDGKPQTVMTLNVAEDGKTMSVLVQDKIKDTSTSYTARKM